jgi:hypothetical protein
MKPFVITSARSDNVQIPFQIETDGGKVVEFTIPRMTFLAESVTRAMKKALLDLDKPVPQFNQVTGEPMYQMDAAGVVARDEDGQQMPLMGPPQRTAHEKTRAVAEAMLKCVVDAATFKELQKLTVGELDQIVAHWTDVSTQPLNDPGADLGESSASLNS